MMKRSGKLLLIIILNIVLAGCSPFGNFSIIEITSDLLDLDKDSKSDLISGGTTVGTTPASGQSADIHQMTFSVGKPYRQTATVTGDGHNVVISVTGGLE